MFKFILTWGNVTGIVSISVGLASFIWVVPKCFLLGGNSTLFYAHIQAFPAGRQVSTYSQLFTKKKEAKKKGLRLLLFFLFPQTPNYPTKSYTNPLTRVILSAAKDLNVEILRRPYGAPQNDKTMPINCVEKHGNKSAGK